MPHWTRFRRKIWILFHRQEAEREIARDIESQLGLMEDEWMSRGLPPADARHAARRCYGGVEQAKELAREELTFTSLEQLVQDTRHAFRSIVKSRAFAAAALVSLALGVGANAAIYTLVNAILLKSLPVPDPDRIAQIQARMPGFESSGFSYPAFRELRQQREIFADVIGFSRRQAVAEVAGEAHPVSFETVTGSFFSFFGARPFAGRLLDEEDDRVEGEHAVCVLAYRYWQSRFGGDPQAIGRSIRVGGVPLQIVGIAGRDFSGPELQWRADLWVPTALRSLFGGPREDSNSVWIHTLARLRPGLSSAAAGARLAAASRAIEDALPKRRANAGAVYGFRDASRGFDSWRTRLSDPLLILMGAVALVLLVACANLANILVARTTVRRQEFAVKLSLGIPRWRLVRQLLSETFLLVLLGGALGLFFSLALTRFLLSVFNSGNTSGDLQVSPDASVLAFTFGVCVAVTLAAGLYPAWLATHTAPGSGLKATLGQGIRVGAVRRFLILVQVAAAVVLLFGASLFTHSLSRLKTVPLGFELDRVLTVGIAAAGPQNATKAVASPPALNELLSRVRQLPYVESAAFSQPAVLSGEMMSRDIEVTDSAGHVRSAEDVYLLFAGPRYFTTMRMPVLRGRDFTPGDRPGSKPVAVINQRLASLLWPGQNPIGKYIGGWGARDLEVIGVVANSKYSDVREHARAIVYQCFDQTPVRSAALQLRFRGEAARIEREVRLLVKSAAPAYEISKVSSLELLRDGLIAQDRLLTFLSALFAALGLALALTGVYGLISFSVARRTREIGIRVSVGATRTDIVLLFLRETLTLTAAGLAIGVPLALQLARLTRNFLFGVSTADPAGLCATLAVVLLGAAAASLIPARRALRISPVEALRFE